MTDNLDELRHIEGFPVGEDEDLIALSDPPHYTAYPNPHIAEFIQKWGKPYDEANDDYHREPFVADVLQSRNEPIYYAHTYHTKVPYEAIAQFIEHYTEPGGIVLDGFCGSGMTGIAAQVTGRCAILCDLSPGSAFLARNYNLPLSDQEFNKLACRLTSELVNHVGWLYDTRLLDGRQAKVNFVIWSQVFKCPYCDSDVVFWDAAVRKDEKRVLDLFLCPNCSSELSKDICEVAFGSDGRVRMDPVLLFALPKGLGTNFEKIPSDEDIDLLRRIQDTEVPEWYPIDRMPEGDEARRNDKFGITNVHHFFSKRNLWALATLYRICRDTEQPFSLFLFTSMLEKSSIRTMTIISNYLHQGRGGFAGKPMTGTLYVPGVQTEASVVEQVKSRVASTRRFISKLESQRIGDAKVAITTQSTTDLRQIPDNTIDYIFVDPPFGANLMYSELNFIAESWLRVKTNNAAEAIINRTQGKALDEYRSLMIRAFQEMYRVLKPNRWITVEFHNSKASVWNAIQEGLSRAGFVVAQVVTLSKGRASFIQYTSPGSVKNDLVINAYKPRAGFSQRFISQAGRGLEADFVRQHLAQLPIAANMERSKEMLYSKYLAYYVQHGYQVAYNAEQFYRALPQWGLVELDGYWFADEAQANEYEKRKARLHGKSPAAQDVLFISDERSARQWLWHFLETPKSYDEIYTAFVKALQTPEDQLPEPMTMLEEGFVRTNGQWKRPDALTQTELEKRRQARLLRQFEEYLELARAGRPLKEVRKEALVVGFTEAYRAGHYQDIITVGKRLDKRLLESSPDLFDFVDIAEAKVER